MKPDHFKKILGNCSSCCHRMFIMDQEKYICTKHSFTLSMPLDVYVCEDFYKPEPNLEDILEDKKKFSWSPKVVDPDVSDKSVKFFMSCQATKEELNEMLKEFWATGKIERAFLSDLKDQVTGVVVSQMSDFMPCK